MQCLKVSRVRCTTCLQVHVVVCAADVSNLMHNQDKHTWSEQQSSPPSVDGLWPVAQSDKASHESQPRVQQLFPRPVPVVPSRQAVRRRHWYTEEAHVSNDWYFKYKIVMALNVLFFGPIFGMASFHLVV